MADPAGVGQVDALLVGQRAPAEVGVQVVAEDGGQAAAQAQAAGGDGEVGDAAGTGAHPLGEDLGAGGRCRGKPGEDDVEEHRALDEYVVLVRLICHVPVAPLECRCLLVCCPS